jgi:adenosylhomocysteine nucleosidase
MGTVGIIAAMPQEREACLRFIKGWDRTRIGPFRCDRFWLLDRDCWLTTSGIGLKQAAQATRALIESIHPQLLVSVGVAGAVNPDLEIGDVIISRNTCLIDQGLPGASQPLALLSDAAWQAAEQALRPRRAHLLSGTAITTRGTQFVQRQPEHMTNPVLEMETMGIVQVAMEQGIPLLSLRGISDGPRAPIPFDLEVAMDEDYNLRMGLIIKSVLRHPKVMLQLGQMRRNTRKAAESAAIALMAVLSQPEPVISP